MGTNGEREREASAERRDRRRAQEEEQRRKEKNDRRIYEKEAPKESSRTERQGQKGPGADNRAKMDSWAETIRKEKRGRAEQKEADRRAKEKKTEKKRSAGRNRKQEKHRQKMRREDENMQSMRKKTRKKEKGRQIEKYARDFKAPSVPAPPPPQVKGKENETAEGKGGEMLKPQNDESAEFKKNR